MIVVAFLLVCLGFTGYVFWLHDYKQATRLPPDKHGYRAPAFLLFERGVASQVLSVGLLLYGLIWIAMIAWAALT